MPAALHAARRGTDWRGLHARVLPPPPPTSRARVPSPPPCPSTHVAGTICGTNTGVAMNCELCAVKVLGNDGKGSSAGILGALNHVASQCHSRKCVVNMSIGGSQPEPGPAWTAITQASIAILACSLLTNVL